MKIKYLNKNIIISSFDNEPENLIKKKLEFIKKMENKKIDSNLVNKYSKIWINIKFKKCKYQSNIYNYIKKIDKTI